MNFFIFLYIYFDTTPDFCYFSKHRITSVTNRIYILEFAQSINPELSKKKIIILPDSSCHVGLEITPEGWLMLFQGDPYHTGVFIWNRIKTMKIEKIKNMRQRAGINLNSIKWMDHSLYDRLSLQFVEDSEYQPPAVYGLL